jgi:hypothetical protein
MLPTKAGLWSVVVCRAGDVDRVEVQASLLVEFSALLLRSVFLFCRLAPTGNRFMLPQDVQAMTKISAHGFLPPLLSFSIVCVAVRPGMRMVLQHLQIDRFSSADSLTCPFRETVCICEPSSRARLDGPSNVKSST